MLTIWKNTNILDDRLPNMAFTERKELATIAVLGSKPIDLLEFPQLKGIFRVGVGLDNVPVEQAKKSGIIVRTTSKMTNEYIYEETASFTCYLILRMLYSSAGSVDPWEIHSRVALKNKTLLIIGMGNIGKRVAEKMSSFMKIDSFDILDNEVCSLKSMVPKADCITVHIPLNSSTRDFFNEEKLSWMKPRSVLVNTSRGAIVEENALFKQINEGRIKAAFDVFWKKPYDGKLKQFYPDKFFMSPHLASKCDEYLQSSAQDLINFIEVFQND